MQGTEWTEQKVFITDDCEVDSHVAGGGIAKVHAAPIDPLVCQLEVVNQELCRMGRGSEVRAVRKGGG